MPLLAKKRYQPNHAGMFVPASAALLDGSESDGTNHLTGGVGMTSGWSTSGATLNTAFATSPDGTSNACRLIEGGTDVRHIVFQQATSISTLVTRHISVYAKYISRRYLQVHVAANAGGQKSSVYFDLQTGAITDSDLIGGATSITNAAITAAVNGFYKCEYDFVLGSSGTDTPFVVLAMSNVGVYGAPLSSDNPTYLGDSASNLHVWRAKLT